MVGLDFMTNDHVDGLKEIAMDLSMFTWLFGFVWLCWTVVYAFATRKKVSIGYALLLGFSVLYCGTA